MTLQLYLLRQLALSSGFALVGLCLLVLPGIAVQAVQRVGGAGLSAVGEYVPLVIIELFPYLVPIAFLLGVVATFGRLAVDNEWTAICMAGIHPARALLPGLLLALVATGVTYHVLATVAPEWKFAQRTYLRESEIETLKGLGRGRTQFSIGDFFVDAARTDGEGTFYEVILGVPTGSLSGDDEPGADDAEDEVLVIIADAARIEFQQRDLVIFFSNAHALRENQEFKNESPYYRRSLEDLVGAPRKTRNAAKFLSNDEMGRRIAGDLPEGAAEMTEKRRTEYRFERQRRIALATTYVIFLLLGAATGLWLRTGTQLGAMTAAIGYAFLYFVLNMRLGKELTAAGLLPPDLAAWAANAIYLVGALMLARKVLWR